MESPLELFTLSDARASPRVLYDHFYRQWDCAQKYGYMTWMLAVWPENVGIAWGFGSDVSRLCARLEKEVPVKFIHYTYGLKVTISRSCMRRDRARDVSAGRAPEWSPAPLAMNSSQESTK